MSIKLVTGCAGEAQVTSADAGALNACILGSGKYVLDGGSKFALSVTSATSVTVGTGEALVNGRHVRCDSPTELAVDAGAQGSKRNDLVCVRYTRALDGIESAALVVVKGTPTSGTPADPAYSDGSVMEGAATVDMPLWRLPIDGITVGEPERVYAVQGGIADAVGAAKEASSLASQVSAKVGARRLISGTKVVNARSNRPTLFTSAQYSALTGHAFNAATDAVFVMNGHSEATPTIAYGVNYYAGDGSLRVALSANPNGNIRFNYLIVCSA